MNYFNSNGIATTADLYFLTSQPVTEAHYRYIIPLIKYLNILIVYLINNYTQYKL